MKQKLLFAVMLLCMTTGIAKAQVVTALVDGDTYFIQNANTTLSERNLYWQGNDLRTRSDATPLSVIFKAHQVEEGGQTYWTFEITSSNYKGYYLGRTTDNNANARAVDTNQKYLWTVSYATSTGDDGDGFVLNLKGENNAEQALMMNGSANWVCAYSDLNNNDKTRPTSHWIFTKVEGAQAVQQPSSDYIVNVTTDYLGEADNFSDNDENTRFRSPKYWIVENFDVDCGGDGHKQGVDRHPGYNCLQLGTWDQNGNAQDNSRLYKEVTLPAGKYYFGAKYHAIESGAYDNDFLFVTTTNPSNSLTKDNIINSLAYAPMAGSAGGDNYYGIYFELAEETTLYLGWLANSSVWHSEFRASGITLRKTTTNPGVQEAQQPISTYSIDLTTEKLVEANGFSATTMGSRYGTPANWTVEDFGLDPKNGIDNYPGYNCLQLGRWEENATTTNMANSRLYRQVTLPAGRYYFGAMYESLPNESKQSTFMFAATNPQSLTIGNVWDNAFACARMDNAATSERRYYGIYFDLNAETTLYLGWLTNSTVQYSEFRVRAVTLRQVGSEEGVLSSPWTQLTELPAVADYGKYFYVIKDNPRNLIMVADNVGDSDQNQVRAVKSMWYAKNINVGEDKKALWTFDDYDATYQVLTNASYQNCVFQTEYATNSCYHAGDNLFDTWSRAEFNYNDGTWTIRNVYHGEKYLGTKDDNAFNFVGDTHETYFNKDGQFIGHFDLFSISKGLYVKTYENTASASAEHPIDLTYIVDNPGAERSRYSNDMNNSSGLRGWVNASEWNAEGNGLYDGLVGKRYFERHTDANDDATNVASDIYQEFTDLPAGFYEFSAVALGGENLVLYANNETVTAPTGSSSRVSVIGEVTYAGTLRIGARAYNVTDDWVKFDDVTLKYLYEEEPTSVIGVPTWNFVVDGYVSQPINNITATFDGATTNTGSEFAILNNNASVTLSDGTDTYNGTISLSGKTLTMEFAGFTIETGKSYTVTLPAGTVGYDGQIANEAYNVTFHTPYAFEGRYYLYNQKANSFLSFNGNNEYSQSMVDNYGKVFAMTIDQQTGNVIMHFDNGYYLGEHQYDHVATNYYLQSATDGCYIRQAVLNNYMYVSGNNVLLAETIEDMADATWVFVPEAKKITLDEASETAPTVLDDAYVTLTRTLSSDYWNTFCSPVAITAEEITATFGEGTKVREMNTEAAVENNEIKFKDATAIEAGVPYLVKPAQTVKNPTFAGKTVVAEGQTIENGDYKYIGILAKTSLAAPEAGATALDLYLSSTDGTMKKPGENGATLKGMRAYFNVPVEAEGQVKLFIAGEDTPTSIDEIDGLNLKNAPMYNLAGQRVGKAQKGIYIVNGKKVAIK